MTTTQKIIKYLAMAFAVFLIFTIISSILGGIFGLSKVLGLKKNNTISKELSNLEWNKDNETIRNLDININSSNLTIKLGENFKIDTNNDNIKCNQKGETLKIEENNNWFFENDSAELVIYIPRGIEIDKTVINTGAGSVNIEELITEKLKLNLGAGETKIEKIVTNDAKIDTGAGKLKIASGNINDLDLDIGIGETDITARITGESKIDTGIGSVKLNLIGAKEDYKINVSKGIGEVKIAGEKVADNETVGNGENVIKLNGGIGEIKVEFELEK